MTTIARTALALAAAATSMAALNEGALARSGKEYFSQTYQFKQPMKGIEGSQGNFYCSYRNQPIFKEVNGKRVKVGYELFQHCY